MMWRTKPQDDDDERAFFKDITRSGSDLSREASESLAETPPRLSPKFIYDAEGSRLFEEITKLPEYYVTRTELGILDAAGPQIADLAGEGVNVIELGSGSDVKIRRLLSALRRPKSYMAMDISPEAVDAATRALAGDFPDLEIAGLSADFTHRLPDSLFDALPSGRRILFFPGSTIGNFEPDEARELLTVARDIAGDGGALIIGLDLVKSTEILLPAYDDEAGVTAAFNKNVLRRLRRDAGAEVDLDAFDHQAVWIEDKARIEMRLVANRATRIRLGDRSFSFRVGDHIHTESSHKFTHEAAVALAVGAGFRATRHWTDPRGFFAVHWWDAAADDVNMRA